MKEFIKKYLAVDKLLHIMASIILVLVIGGFMITRIGPWQYDAVVIPYIFSAVFTFFIGMCKEGYDHYFGGSEETEDLYADAIGIGIGEIILLILFV